MTPVLEARELSYSYPDGTAAIDGFDLTVDAGERVAIVGPNGAGKSTLIQLLGGLVDPDCGSVTYFAGEKSADNLRDRIAVVPQHPDEYLFNPTVRDDLEYGPAQLSIPRERARERVQTLAERLELSALLEKPPFRLSGGEQRRAALASAVAVDPDLLLLDEPVADVDATNRERILELLEERHTEGETQVFSTPNVDLVPRVADRVVLVDATGTVIADGATSEILTDGSLLRESGLEAPTVARLFVAAGIDDPPLTVEEGADRLSRLFR
ncbi:MAG: energy-coupling factor ABC transporter ATP-binding protein [Halapricum sp.]